MSQPFNKLYEFGGFRLDSEERVLWRGEQMLALPSRVFDTLLTLVEREGRVVSKSELMGAVWADAFVEESNLSQNIYTLRRTLGVDEQGRQFIETVPRRGYRFAVPVRLLCEVPKSGAGHIAEAVADRPATSSSAGAFANNLSHPAPGCPTNGTHAGAAPQTQRAAPSAAAEARPHASRRRVLSAGLAALILTALGLGIYQLVVQRGERGEAAVAPIERIRFQKLTDSGDVLFPTISPSGELLAYVRLEGDQRSVWVKQIATGSSVRTLPPSQVGYRSLAFSPDGRYLFFREDADPGAIYQTSPFGGAQKKVAVNVWSDFSISPDGKQFAFVRRDTGRNAYLLILSNVDGSGERELSASESPLNHGRIAPAWSPDGAKLIVTTASRQPELPALLTLDVATSQATELKTRSWRVINCVLWAPNGDQLLLSARTPDELYSQVWVLDYPGGQTRRLTNDLEGYFWLSLSADGRMLVTRQQRTISHLWLLTDGDVKKARPLTSGERSLDGYVGLAWTPDGKIVFSNFAGNITNLYTVDPVGGDRVQLTTNAGQENTYPAISQDGRHIVFTSDRTGAKQIWRMDIDGRNQKQLTFGEEQKARAQSAALSPDGAEVFFIRYGAGPAAIWKVPIGGGTAVQVSHLADAAAEGFLSISPDGKWLAYRHVSTRSEAKGQAQAMRIGVLPTDGGAAPKLFDLPMRRPLTQWSADSAAFYYVAGTFDSSSLWRQPLDGGEPQKLLDSPGRIFNFAWSRDDKNLVLSRGRQLGDAILITNLP